MKIKKMKRKEKVNTMTMAKEKKISTVNADSKHTLLDGSDALLPHSGLL